jgi:hypothetical protein
MAKDEKEEIIDLTEVVEEPAGSGPKAAAGAEDPFRGGEGPPGGTGARSPGDLSSAGIPGAPEERPAPKTGPQPPADRSCGVEPPKSLSADAERAVEALQEALTAMAEEWLTKEGQQILDQGAREMIPRIAAETLRKETEGVRAELEKMEAQKEALRRKTEEWISTEGMRVCERVAREMFPAIAAEILRREIEKLKTEAEEKA